MGHLHIMRLEQETTLTIFFQNVFAELYAYLWATLYIHVVWLWLLGRLKLLFITQNVKRSMVDRLMLKGL